MEQGKLRAGSESWFVNNDMRIHLNLLDACNLRCSYCLNAAKRKGDRVLDIQDLLRFLGVISTLERDHYTFNLAGGEPLLYPHLETLCHALPELFPSPPTHTCRPNNIELRIATNGTVSYKKLRTVLESIYAIPGSLFVSVHEEQSDGGAACMDNIKALPDDLKERVHCKFLLSGKNVLKVRDRIDRLTEHGVSNIGVAFMYGGTVNFAEDYTEEARALAFALVRKFPLTWNEWLFYERLVDGKRVKKVFSMQDRHFDGDLVDYRGMWCLAGVNALRVGPDGMVRRCFGLPEELDIASLGEGGGSFPESFSRPVLCSSRKCNCPTFLRLPKWLDPADAPAYALPCGGA